MLRIGRQQERDRGRHLLRAAPRVRPGTRGRNASGLPSARSSTEAWSAASVRIMGVSVGPGETVLMRTPRGTVSIASTRSAWRRPALEAQ